MPPNRRWSDRWKKDAIRLVLFEGALAQRDFSAAQSALRSACARWPHSPVAWNAYARWVRGYQGPPPVLRGREPPSCEAVVHAGLTRLGAVLFVHPLELPPPSMRQAPMSRPAAQLSAKSSPPSRFLHETGSVRQALKYLQPMRSKHPGSLPLMLLLGHCHLLNTQYSEALGEYLQAWR